MRRCGIFAFTGRTLINTLTIPKCEETHVAKMPQMTYVKNVSLKTDMIEMSSMRKRHAIQSVKINIVTIIEYQNAQAAKCQPSQITK